MAADQPIPPSPTEQRVRDAVEVGHFLADLTGTADAYEARPSIRRLRDLLAECERLRGLVKQGGEQ